ncbi:MAG TPA: thioredoxin domain-containing protein [Pyrinomonadaceae bacterium]|nr:thioredoxin domain-containing protein [Pyrinomonadaceae bacterium]
MKKLLFGLLMMLAFVAPTDAQTAGQPAATRIEAAADCGCEDKPLPEVLGVVNGVKITKQDLSPETQARVDELQREVIEARARELDLQIDSMLLEAEAKKRGVSTSQVLREEVVAKVQAPTEAEAQTFYEQNKARIQGEFKDAKENILAYLSYGRQQELARALAERLRAAAEVKVLARPSPQAAGRADRARALAVVNGKQITAGDVEDSLRPLIFRVQEQAYALRKQDLELKINDLLLTQEAQKRQVTARALLDAEVGAKVPRVTEAEARKFYDENKERISGEFAQIKAQVVEYLQEAEEHKATHAFAERLRRASVVETHLTAPEPPAHLISTDDQPSKGNPQASVTVVEFTDFQCPSCAQQYPVIERIMREYGDRVRLVVRDFPLSQHADAVKAAEAAEAAREQGKYWEYVAVLFRNQSALGADKLKLYATQLGLDRARFDAALDSGKHAEKVERDVLDGQKLGVNGTPTFYVNGKRLSERSYEGLKAAIEAALKAKGATPRNTASN